MAKINCIKCKKPMGNSRHKRKVKDTSLGIPIEEFIHVHCEKEALK